MIARSARGFSLVELMAVVAIIMIVSAIAIPMGLSYIRNYQIMGAAQNVAAEMQRARGQAVRRNTRRGILLNFDYPVVEQFQYTTLDPNPNTGMWDTPVFPANPGVFDPNNRDYGTAPVPPANTGTAPDGSRPHGEPVPLPQDVEFVPGTFSSLLFRADGSVEAVNADNVPGRVVVQDPNGLDWLVTVRNPDNGLSRRVRISRNGRVQVEVP